MIGAPTQTPLSDSSEARDARLKREAKTIETGRQQIARGEGISLEALEDWLQRLDVDENIPVPDPARTANRS